MAPYRWRWPGLILLLAVVGCTAKKPVVLPEDVHYQVSYFKGTCQVLQDGSYICKARFNPLEVRAK